MSNAVNLLRDMLHTDPDQADITGFGQVAEIRNREAYMNNPGIVYQTKGNSFAIRRQSTPGNDNEWRTAGVLMSPPLVDDTPYRVKLSAACTESALLFFFTGYGPLDPTGTDDFIEKCTLVPIARNLNNPWGVFDEVVNIPGRGPQHPDYNRPIAFGLGLSLGSNANQAYYHISVQNLSKTAPQFASSMS